MWFFIRYSDGFWQKWVGCLDFLTLSAKLGEWVKIGQLFWCNNWRCTYPEYDEDPGDTENEENAQSQDEVSAEYDVEQEGEEVGQRTEEQVQEGDGALHTGEELVWVMLKMVQRGNNVVSLSHHQALQFNFKKFKLKLALDSVF